MSNKHDDSLLKQNPVEALSFWKEYLKGFSAATPLTVDRTYFDKVSKDRGSETQMLKLSERYTSKLLSFVQKNQITINTLLHGAWALLLSRYSSESDILFATTEVGHDSITERADSIFDMLPDALPFRIKIPLKSSALSWLKDLHTQYATLGDFKQPCLRDIAQCSEIPVDVPLFESMLVFRDHTLNSVYQEQEAKWTSRLICQLEQPSSPIVILGHLDKQFILQVAYGRRRFDSDTINRLLGHLKTLLDGFICSPKASLSALPLMTGTERNKVLVEWNDTDVPYARDRCIHQLFELQARRTPHNIAAVFGTQHLTYTDLNHKANQIAHYLISAGAKIGTYVAIYLNRSVDMIAALLGVLKAGCTYVPLDTNHPQARIHDILGTLEVTHIVTDTINVANLGDTDDKSLHLRKVLILNTTNASQSHRAQTDVTCPPHFQITDYSDISQLSVENPHVGVEPNDYAYIIFTSGSSGKPKGIIVKHRPVINLIQWVNRTYSINEKDRLLFITSLCFDLSVCDVFGMLSSGGSIHIASEYDCQNPDCLLKLLCSEPITFWDSAPAALQQLVPLMSSEKFATQDSHLRLVFLSGDWIPVSMPDAVRRAFPNTQLIALGGATEATVWSNYFPIKEVPPQWTSIPYGKPIQNAKYYILDPHMNPCPIGVPGELHIGGECLCSGYVTDPVLSNHKFLPDPFSCEAHSQIYKTGDLAKFMPDGNIEFLGRMDQQVKIRGYRVELGEIEATLLEHAALQDSIVIAREDKPGNKQLTAYFVCKPDHHVDTDELQTFLSQTLPTYMIPSVFMVLGAIPVTANGKVDRNSLPKPPQILAEQSCVTPMNAIEQELAQIWANFLDLDNVGIHDSFFDLGGHSILASQILAGIYRAFNVDLSLQTLFDMPTVAKQARIIENTLIEQTKLSELSTILEELDGLSDREIMAQLSEEGNLV